MIRDDPPGQHRGLPVQLPTGLQVCRHALSEGAPFLPVFEVVRDVAKRLIVEFYRAVGYCKCELSNERVILENLEV